MKIEHALLLRLKEDLEGMGVEVLMADKGHYWLDKKWVVSVDDPYFMMYRVRHYGRHRCVRIGPGASERVFQIIKGGAQ